MVGCCTATQPPVCTRRYEGLVGSGGCDLVALTAFYEQHYVCFCFSHTAGQWIHYDDDTRQLIWSKVARFFVLPVARSPPTEGFCALAFAALSRISI